MKKDLQVSDTERTAFLRGYYVPQYDLYHPQGGNGIPLATLLELLTLADISEFKKWYDGQTKEAFEYECTGDCCRSLLVQLLKM
jgi:hypothetical protein